MKKENKKKLDKIVKKIIGYKVDPNDPVKNEGLRKSVPNGK